MKLLNLGCGARYHPSWINIDFISTGSGVIAHNLLTGIPFPDYSFDAVYHSHVLEHFSKDQARVFISQCYKVLKQGGILRIAVPDLEGIVRCYLKKLEECLAGNSGVADDYDWILLELFDQMVRNSAGGDMASFLADITEKDRAFVRSRIGFEADGFWAPKQALPRAYRLKNLVKKFRMGKLFKSLRENLAGWLVYLVAGKVVYKNFKLGSFRASGEIHQWMYDRYSLKRLLENAGFVDIKICTANESRIPDYEKYSLDVFNGNVRKPDSLYIEASKP